MLFFFKYYFFFFFFFFFFNDTATTEIYTLSLHDALPISPGGSSRPDGGGGRGTQDRTAHRSARSRRRRRARRPRRRHRREPRSPARAGACAPGRLAALPASSRGLEHRRRGGPHRSARTRAPHRTAERVRQLPPPRRRGQGDRSGLAASLPWRLAPPEQDRRRLVEREWRGPDLNRRHHGFQPCALPAELPRRGDSV